MMLNTAIVARTRKPPAEASKRVSTSPCTMRWGPSNSSGGTVRCEKRGAAGAYRVPARDAVTGSLAAPRRRRIGDWAIRTVSTRP